MANTYTGKTGKLWVMESTKGRNLVTATEVGVYNDSVDVTANMLDPASGTATILAASTNYIYIGQIFKFSRVMFNYTTAATTGGVMIVEYWNGAWTSIGSSFVDQTNVSGNTLAATANANYSMSWDIPSDWTTGNPNPPNSGKTLYWIRMHTTSNTTVDCVAQLIEPCSGKYMEIPFVNMNLTATEGSGRPEEIIRLNRGNLDTYAHYVQGIDDPILTPGSLSFSFIAAYVDANVNWPAVRKALQCANDVNAPATWPNTTNNPSSISTKGDTAGLVPGLTTSAVPLAQFTDPSKKTVCIQVEWKDGSTRQYREFNEVFISDNNISLTEGVDAVTVNVTGAVYGPVFSGAIPNGAGTGILEMRLGYRW